MNETLFKLRELKDYWKQNSESRKLRQEFQKNAKVIKGINISSEAILQQLRLEISKSNEFVENSSITPSSIMNKIRIALDNLTGEIKAINDEEVKELAIILIELLNLLNNSSYSHTARTIASSADDLMKMYINVPEDIILAREEVYKRIISREMRDMKHDMTKIEAVNNSESFYISEKKAMVRLWLYDLLQLSENPDNHIYIETLLTFVENLMLRLGWNDFDMVSKIEELEKITAISREIFLYGLSPEYLDTTIVDDGYKKR